jgi:hypothetical protein
MAANQIRQEAYARAAEQARLAASTSGSYPEHGGYPPALDSGTSYSGSAAEQSYTPGRPTYGDSPRYQLPAAYNPVYELPAYAPPSQPSDSPTYSDAPHQAGSAARAPEPPQQYPNQQSQQYPNQQAGPQYSDRQYSGEQYSGRQQRPDQQYPNRQYPGQQYPNQQDRNQQYPGQPQPSQELNQQYPDQRAPSQQQSPQQQYQDQQHTGRQYGADQEYTQRQYDPRDYDDLSEHGTPSTPWSAENPPYQPPNRDPQPPSAGYDSSRYSRELPARSQESVDVRRGQPTQDDPEEEGRTVALPARNPALGPPTSRQAIIDLSARKRTRN